MTNPLRLAIAQLNVVVGDLEGNAKRIADALAKAHAAGADLALLPEMAVTGYPPEDLLLRPGFVANAQLALEDIARGTPDIAAVVGAVMRGQDLGDGLFNTAAVLSGGRVQAQYHKMHLPNCAVFDEPRYFRAGRQPLIVTLGETRIGLTVCEDIWYGGGPAEAESLAGAELILNLSASPYHMGKPGERERMLRTRAAGNLAALGFCNLVGGQDELVFDGSSLIIGPDGEVIARARQFAEDLLLADLDLSDVSRLRPRGPRFRHDPAVPVAHVSLPMTKAGPQDPLPERSREWLDRLPEVYEALVLGTRDYVRKNGFQDVVLGLSGGIDSTLVACIAVDALGPEHVHGVYMPSRYSADLSRRLAEELAANLGMDYRSIPIDAVFESYLEAMAESFRGVARDTTEENIQARIRGNIWMALSNKFRWLALTAGNKSELAVGYCTLYGDMAGGYAVLKDVPKMLVYELSRYRNAVSPVIPAEAITRPPSAELRPDQRDDQSLPPYPILDPILQAYVDENRSIDDIVALGYDQALVERVVRLVDGSEFKRRQAAPGVRVSPRAFGKDRRLPIVNRYRKG